MSKTQSLRTSSATKKTRQKSPAWENVLRDKPQQSRRSSSLQNLSSKPHTALRTRDTSLGKSVDLNYSLNSSANYSAVEDHSQLLYPGRLLQQTKEEQVYPTNNTRTNGNGDLFRMLDDSLHIQEPTNNIHMNRSQINDLQRRTFGPVFPSLREELVDSINAGRFVNFTEILALIRYHNIEKDELAERLRTDITIWLDCFLIYKSIICLNNPLRITDLIEYERIIIWIYRETQDPSAWWRYDTAFRRRASLIRLEDWSRLDDQLYTLSSTQLRNSVSCEFCLTNDHTAKRCPFTVITKTHRSRQVTSGTTGENKIHMGTTFDPSTTITLPHNEIIEKALTNPEKASRRPAEGLKLKFAFGYHGYNACNNLFFTQDNELVFHTAALGVVYQPGTHEQRFYFGHDDDVLSLTIHDDEDIVATGQLGKAPSTHVWDAKTMKTIAVLKGFHRRGIICVDFSGDGNMLADVGLDDDHCICVWNWRKEEKLASTRGHKDTVYNLEWNPYDTNFFVTVGAKHIKFWSINGSKIEKRTATFGKAGELTDMLCLCHSPTEQLCYVGSSSGEIYVWQGATFRKSFQAHKGPVYAMFALLQSKEKGYVTGGKDGVVVLWDEMFTKPLRAFKIENSQFPPGTMLLHNCPPVRSIHTLKGRILVGTGHGDIIVIYSDGSMEVVLQGHGEGELWGLAVHPYVSECATVSDDKTLRIWDYAVFRMTKILLFKKGGRCLDYHPTGDTLAVGLNDGSFIIVDTRTLQTLVQIKDRREMISDIKFSPDGTFLGVASHDNMLDIYNVKRGKRRSTCRGSSSYLTHFDWDVKGRLIQTNSGAREHLLYEAPSGNRKTMTVEDILRVNWSEFSCVLGPTVRGIFPPLTDVTDVNCTSRTKDHKLLATGDDFGLVKVFKYPVLHRGAKYRTYKGHCSHVTNTKWTRDDSLLLTVGGMDASLLVWERLSVDSAETDDIESKEDGVPFVQPKFIPGGTIKTPIVKGKPVWE